MIIGIIFAIITLGILTAGIIFMGYGGKVNKRFSKKLMTARVLCQLVSIIVVFVLYLYVK